MALFINTVVLPLLVTITLSAPPPPPPKHVVFFLIDDYGFGDASYKKGMYNGTYPPPTPNLDNLALQGLRLESHYVNKLCSPTRTALLSGRYAYTNGMDDGVIQNGQNIDMPLNLLTIADRLSEGGWKTSAFGKWDAGMTTWGSTPTCRGFDHYNGFYSAASDYYTHMVGPGFDYHNDSCVDDTASKIYTTHRVTTAVQNWILSTIKKNVSAQTFAYVAHEAVHGPLEVPLSYVEGHCEQLIPHSNPTRRIYCGMVRAMDESIGNITKTYSDLGIFNETLFILTGDNGGMPSTGGNNYPLRGNKATVFEGGVRSIAFIAGAGLHPSLIGTISHEIIHVTDWLPTIVGGVAGLSLVDNSTGRPCPTCTRPVAPLDGINQWRMFSTLNSTSNRVEVLLDLQTTKGNPSGDITNIPGSGAIRIGQWKLLHGHQSILATPIHPSSCMLRGPYIEGEVRNSPIPVLKNETYPWCPFGWTPPPRNDGMFEEPQPPPESIHWGGNCSLGKLPCDVPSDSGYLAGQTMLFNVVDDMEERHNVVHLYPDVVQHLLQRLKFFNNSHCDGARCMPDDAGGKAGKPSTKLGPNGTPVWFPWRGDPSPMKCDTNRSTGTGPPMSNIHSHFDAPTIVTSPNINVRGWCWDETFPNSGVPPMVVQVSVDGNIVIPFSVANITRINLPSKTGSPNPEHGFDAKLPVAAANLLAGKGEHKISVNVYIDQHPTSTNDTSIPVTLSPACYKNGKKSICSQ
jgi:arylsulfatase B